MKLEVGDYFVNDDDDTIIKITGWADADCDLDSGDAFCPRKNDALNVIIYLDKGGFYSTTLTLATMVAQKDFYPYPGRGKPEGFIDPKEDLLI